MRNVNIISTKKRQNCDINGILWEIKLEWRNIESKLWVWCG